MRLFTIGSTKKSAAVFFEAIKSNNIEALIDVRLNNSSQLAGFSKGSDLEYFLREISNCGYAHELIFAPEKELMDGFKSKKISLPEYEERYTRIVEDRNAIDYFMEHYSNAESICLLCSEDTPEHCHRRVLADLLKDRMTEATLKHL